MTSRATAVAGAVLAVALAGCASEPEQRELIPMHVGTGEVLHGLDDMVARAPALESSEAVAYSGGTLGVADPGRLAIGPSDYWVHAVVDYAPGDVAAMGADAAAADLPELVPSIAALAPECAYVRDAGSCRAAGLPPPTCVSRPIRLCS